MDIVILCLVSVVAILQIIIIFALAKVSSLLINLLDLFSQQVTYFEELALRQRRAEESRINENQES